MKTKKRFILGIAALMFTLAACTELTGPGELSGEPIPKGMGQAHIRLDQVNARTTIPKLEGLYFTLDFIPESGKEEDTVKMTLEEGLTLTVALESGTWDLEVKGYRNSSTDSPTVRGTSSVTVIEGISSNVVVDLKPDFSGGGTGILDYNSVTFPENVDRATLVLYSLNPPGTSQKIDLLKSEEEETSEEETDEEETTETEEPTAPGTIALPAGSYQAFIDLFDGTDNKVSAAVWTGIVHIYDGATTSLVQTFDTPNFAAPKIVGASEKTLAGKLDLILSYFPSGSHTITLDGDETLGPLTALNVTGDKDITITIEGKGKTISLEENGSLLTLGADPGSSLSLILEDITLQGKDGNTASLVQVNSGGTLELEVGSVLTGNTSTSGNGGGVSVADGGTLNMSGGKISGNTASNGSAHGGGVYVANGGKFTMSDGDISGNKTPATGKGGDKGGGGVFVDSGGEFTLSGGTVSGNTSSCDGGGVFVYGSGGKFTMNGGTISGNSAQFGGGVYASAGGTFIMNGGVVYGSGAGTGKANTAPSGGPAFYKNGGGISSLNTTDLTLGTP
jgi:hypothetical protein